MSGRGNRGGRGRGYNQGGGRNNRGGGGGNRYSNYNDDRNYDRNRNSFSALQDDRGYGGGYGDQNRGGGYGNQNRGGGYGDQNRGGGYNNQNHGGGYGGNQNRGGGYGGNQNRGGYGGGRGGYNNQGRGGGPNKDQRSPRDVIPEDLGAERPMYFISCYGHAKDKPNDISGDVSFEELRWHMYQAHAAGIPAFTVNQDAIALVRGKEDVFKRLLQQAANPPTTGGPALPTGLEGTWAASAVPPTAMAATMAPSHGIFGGAMAANPNPFQQPAANPFAPAATGHAAALPSGGIFGAAANTAPFGSGFGPQPAAAAHPPPAAAMPAGGSIFGGGGHGFPQPPVTAPPTGGGIFGAPTSVFNTSPVGTATFGNAAQQPPTPIMPMANGSVMAGTMAGDVSNVEIDEIWRAPKWDWRKVPEQPPPPAVW